MYLPTALSVALRPLFPFHQAQYAQVLPLKPAPFCKLFAGLGSTNKLPFLFSYLSLAFSLAPCPLLHVPFYLNLFGKNCFLSPSCSIRLQWVRGHSFLPGNDSADELARRGALLVPSAIPCCLSFLISRIHSSFSRTEGVRSHLNFLTHRFPRFPPRNLCSLSSCSRCSLSFSLQQTQLSVKLLFL